MTVAQLKKLTLIGDAGDRRVTLDFLQALGCMHLVPLVPLPDAPEEITARGARDAYAALRFLAEVGNPRRQVRRAPDFDMTRFVAEVQGLMHRIRETRDRRDFLAHRIREVRPWWDLDFPPHDALAGHRLWFYRLPVKHRKALDAVAYPWSILGTDHRFLYVVLIAQEEPPDDVLPVARTHTGARPLHKLEEDLEDTEIALEALEAERLACTRYLDLMRKNLSEAESRAELAHAEQQVLEEDRLFAVQGWVPVDRVEAVLAGARARGLAVTIEDPRADELPPTLLEQPDTRSAGVDLAMFYQVPSARGWDPTVMLLISFAIFFAMIVADAGYGLLILAGLLLGWRSLGKSVARRSWRRLGVIIAVCTIGYGVLVGSYFGVSPDPQTLLGQMQVLTLGDFDTMMLLSIVIGVLHLVIANLLAAYAARGRRRAYANLGWAVALVAGLMLWRGSMAGQDTGLPVAALAGGLLAVFLCSSDRDIKGPVDWLWRALDGAKALSGAMGAFGDVLSYMRLFALGLASASLAITFNDLAVGVMHAMEGPGILFGLLIMLVGHALNFGLALMSGVVHGLRLNYIEFYKWGLPDEGVAFRPLARKEVQE
ncbi:hypothetical protein [Shimia sp. SDUM112013]|uniref:V-type ATP synthase subunit I n=1 Tax=Shimia sp. SDUM112013 TaxID=3136160 RepID=UPI0032EE9586